MRVHHGVAQLVQQQPRAFVAAEPELGLKLQGRDAIRVAAEKMDRREPDGQRQLAAMHHGAGRHRSVPAATCALPGEPFPRQFPALDTAETRAHEPVCARSGRNVITITGISDHLRPEWLITITGIRNCITDGCQTASRGRLLFASSRLMWGKDGWQCL